MKRHPMEESLGPAADTTSPRVNSQSVSPAVVCRRPGHYPNRKEYITMQRHPYPWQAALVAGLCVLANPVFAEKPREERQSLGQTGGTAHAQAATAADQALAERVR